MQYIHNIPYRQIFYLQFIEKKNKWYENQGNKVGVSHCFFLKKTAASFINIQNDRAIINPTMS